VLCDCLLKAIEDLQSAQYQRAITSAARGGGAEVDTPLSARQQVGGYIEQQTLQDHAPNQGYA
jgi:hypothetical protein